MLNGVDPCMIGVREIVNVEYKTYSGFHIPVLSMINSNALLAVMNG